MVGAGLSRAAPLLPDLARELQAIVPGYALCVTGPDRHAAGRPADDPGAIDSIIAGIDPGFGQAYTAMRAWNLLIWQPVLVTVLCAEAEGRAAAVERARYQMGPEFGCVLEELPAATSDVRGHAAGPLDRITKAIFDALSRRLRLRPELARRQLADRVLGVLHRRALLGFAPVETTRRAAADWLSALDLEGRSALEPLPLDGGGTGLWLRRRSCCLEYRAAPDFLCATCPRRERATRIALSQDEWQAHVSS